MHAGVNPEVLIQRSQVQISLSSYFLCSLQTIVFMCLVSFPCGLFEKYHERKNVHPPYQYVYGLFISPCFLFTQLKKDYSDYRDLQSPEHGGTCLTQCQFIFNLFCKDNMIL